MGWRYLAYFDKDKLLGKIDLSTCTDIKEDHEKVPLQLLLFTPSRIWYLKCENDESYQIWLRIIRLVVYYHQNRASIPFYYLIEKIVGCTLYALSSNESDSLLLKHFVVDLLHIVHENGNNPRVILESVNEIIGGLEVIGDRQNPILNTAMIAVAKHLQEFREFVNSESKPLSLEIKKSESTSAPASLIPDSPSSPMLKRSEVVVNTASVKIGKKSEVNEKQNTQFHEDIFLAEKMLAEKKESEEEETPQEVILRLTKIIRRVFLRQIDAFKTQDRQEFALAQKESIETSTKLWEITNTLTEKLRNKGLLQKLVIAKSQFIMAWKDSLTLLKERMASDNHQETIMIFKKRLPEIGCNLNDASQQLSSLVSEVSQIIFVESELQKAVDMFSNPFNNLNPSPIAIQLVDLVKILVKECFEFFGSTFTTARTELFISSLQKLYDVIKKIIEDCQQDSLNLGGVPKNLFLDVTIQIQDFSSQLISIVDLILSSGRQAIYLLQVSATMKRLYNVLEPLVSYDINAKVDDPLVSEKATSDIIKRSILNESSIWRRSTPLNMSGKAKVETGLQRHSGVVGIKPRPSGIEKSMWEEEEEGNILYLSSNEAKVLEEEEKMNRKLTDSTTNFPIDHTKVIRAATINKLIMKLTNESSVDVNFLKSFLATYRSFTTPEIFWKKIMERYNVPPLPKNSTMTIEEHQKNVVLPIRLRVCNVIVKWISSCWVDISDTLLKSVEEFVNITLPEDKFFGLHEKLKTAIEKAKADSKLAESQENSRYARQRSGRDRMKEMKELAESVSKVDIVQKSLIDYLSDPQKIAEHLTMIEWKLYSSIKYVELLNQAWNKKELRHLAPNVLKMIARFNDLASWVASNVLWQEQLAQRVRIFSRFIHVAKHLFDMNNFNATMAILSGLNISAIYRLKFTVAELPKKDRQTLSFLMDKLSNKNAYKEYRSILKNANPPIIPYLGVYLTDLTFIEEGNKNEIEGLVNFHKRRLVYKVLAEIEQFQLTGYNCNIDPNIMILLTQLNYVQDDTEMYAISLLREPRNAERSDIR